MYLCSHHYGRQIQRFIGILVLMFLRPNLPRLEIRRRQTVLPLPLVHLLSSYHRVLSRKKIIGQKCLYECIVSQGLRFYSVNRLTLHHYFRRRFCRQCTYLQTRPDKLVPKLINSREIQ